MDYQKMTIDVTREMLNVYLNAMNSRKKEDLDTARQYMKQYKQKEIGQLSEDKLFHHHITRILLGYILKQLYDTVSTEERDAFKILQTYIKTILVLTWKRR
jgi:hypothetical protein